MMDYIGYICPFINSPLLNYHVGVFSTPHTRQRVEQPLVSQQQMTIGHYSWGISGIVFYFDWIIGTFIPLY